MLYIVPDVTLTALSRYQGVFAGAVGTEFPYDCVYEEYAKLRIATCVEMHDTKLLFYHHPTETATSADNMLHLVPSPVLLRAFHEGTTACKTPTYGELFFNFDDVWVWTRDGIYEPCPAYIQLLLHMHQQIFTNLPITFHLASRGANKVERLVLTNMAYRYGVRDYENSSSSSSSSNSGSFTWTTLSSVGPGECYLPRNSQLPYGFDDIFATPPPIGSAPFYSGSLAGEPNQRLFVSADGDIRASLLTITTIERTVRTLEAKDRLWYAYSEGVFHLVHPVLQCALTMMAANHHIPAVKFCQYRVSGAFGCPLLMRREGNDSKYLLQVCMRVDMCVDFFLH